MKEIKSKTSDIPLNVNGLDSSFNDKKKIARLDFKKQTYLISSHPYSEVICLMWKRKEEASRYWENTFFEKQKERKEGKAAIQL